MKKRGYFLGLILAMLLFLPMSVMAECSYEDQVRLSSEAANVKFSYEIVEATSEEELAKWHFPHNDYIVVHVFNITENLHISMEDNWVCEDCLYPGIKEEIDYDQTQDGTYSFEVQVGGLRDVRINVFSQNSSCDKKNQRSTSLIIPGFNSYSLLDECKNSSEYYCEKYPSVVVSMSKEQVLSQLKKESAKPETPEENQNGFWENFGKVILTCIGVAVLIVGVVVVIRIIMKKRSNVK